MNWRSGMAATLLATALAPMIANATAPALSGGAPVVPSQGVVSYRADFFAAARPATALDMIQRLPGFSFDGGAQVRGFADAAGNVLIDGERPTSKQDDLQHILQRISASDVDHIDVIRGGAPGIDMQGRTILANVVRKRGKGASQGAVALQERVLVDEGGQLPQGRLEWSRRDDDHSFELALSSADHIDDGTGSGPHTTYDNGVLDYDSHLWTRARFVQTQLTAAYEGPLAGGKFKINGMADLENYLDHEADTAFLPTTTGDDTYKDANDAVKSELGLHYTRDFGSKLTLETLAIQQLSRSHEHSLYLSDLDLQPDNEIYSIANVNAESIVRGTLRYRPFASLTLEGALEGAYNTQATETFYSVNGVNQQLPAADEHVAEKRGDAALTATWSPSSHYTLETGIRLEESTVTATGGVVASKTLFYPKPRVVFTWSPDASDQIRLRGEREVGQLDFSAFAASGSLNVGGVHAGNPNVLPQQSWVAEATYERRFLGSGDATVTLRHMDITDAVDRIVGVDPQIGDFDEGGNLPHGTENDLVVDLTVPLDKLLVKNGQFKASATWRDAEVRDPTTGLERPQTAVHPLEWEAHYTQDMPSWKSTWGLDFFYGWKETDYRFDEIDVIRFGPRLTAYWEYKPTSGLSVRAEASNLFSQGVFKSVADYDGPRGTPGNLAPASLDERTQQIGPLISLKLRQAFG